MLTTVDPLKVVVRGVRDPAYSLIVAFPLVVCIPARYKLVTILT